MDIKNCPFCGSHGLALGEHAEDCYLIMFAHWVLECHGAKLETSFSHNEMVKAWNTRADYDKLHTAYIKACAALKDYGKDKAELDRLRGLEATYVHTIDAHNNRIEDLENLARAAYYCDCCACEKCPFVDVLNCSGYKEKLVKELGLLEGE